MSGNRLVWFQHFHKAAGTSVVKTALANGETPFPVHINGIPRASKMAGPKHRIPLGEYDEARLNRFVDDCLQRGISFVATEWQTPLLEVLSERSDVVLITVLREPWKRFQSNVRFDYRREVGQFISFPDFVNGGPVHTSFNYYCRMLTDNHDPAQPVTRQDMERAAQRLKLFDHLEYIDSVGAIERLAKSCGWAYDGRQHNQTMISYRLLMKLIKRRRFRRIIRELRAPNLQASADFKQQFYRENHWDYDLFEAVLGDQFVRQPPNSW